MTETLQRWIAIAEERLAGTHVQVFLGPANDDPPFVDEVLARGGRVVNPEGRAIELPDGWSMVSCGWSNPTPWDSPREEPEEHLLERIEVEVGRLASLEHAVFNLHVPPKDSQLDKAAVLNPDLSTGHERWRSGARRRGVDRGTDGDRTPPAAPGPPRAHPPIARTRRSAARCRSTPAASTTMASFVA